ncbi:RraA family protein [Herbiconiux daphne]|uniref:Putative 4-hydroxy-4-methyl-2-oxoglutarate aldolase n=1 Tax=Herbiconiux daphne TaxID=2970914 RepID=A0ABT2H3K2_9MICO|nr:hypothetical protein [Herbiconiux daphne]MCS5734521.1 hypothetical protein [Herbiconiux daphne]
MTDSYDLNELREELLTLGAATLYEASGWDTFLPPQIRPAWPGARIVGRALPVKAAAGDNLPLHLAVERAQPGDVLVVDAGGAPHGYWGEVLAVAAQSRGVLGLVIHGGVRDVDRLEELGFAAFSSLIALQGTLKDDAGTVGDAIRIGTASIEEGDIVIADRDGVAVIPAGIFADTLEYARARALREEQYMNRLRDGELTMDLLGLRLPAEP